MAPAQDWANASTLEESGTSMPDSSSPAMFLSPETRGLEKDIGNDKPDSTMKPKRPNWYSDSSEEIDVLDYEAPPEDEDTSAVLELPQPKEATIEDGKDEASIQGNNEREVPSSTPSSSPPFYLRSQFAEKHRFINETSEKTAEASVFQTEPVACVDEGPDLPEPPTDDDGDDHGFDVTKFHVETDQEAGNSSDPAGKGPDAEDETEAEATSTKSDTYREKLLRLRNAYKKECKDMQHAMDSRRLTYSEASAYLNGIPNRTIKRDPRNSYQAKRVRLLRGQSKSLKLASYGEIPKKDRIIPIRAREIPGTREWIDFKGNDGTSARRKKNDIWRPAFCADGANFCTGFNPTGETRRFAETERKPDTGSMPRAKYHSGEGFDEVRVPFTGRPISYEGDNGVRFVHAEHLTEPASRMEALEKWAALADGNPISLTTELAPSFRFEEVMPAGENKKRKRSEVEDNEAEELKRAAKRVNEGFRFTLFD